MNAREWLADVNRRLDAGEDVTAEEYGAAIEAYARAARRER